MIEIEAFSEVKVGRVEMTRFARAVGSKASNKREEEEATPWSMMVAGVSQFKILRTDILFLNIVTYS